MDGFVHFGQNLYSLVGDALFAGRSGSSRVRLHLLYSAPVIFNKSLPEFLDLLDLTLEPYSVRYKSSVIGDW